MNEERHLEIDFNEALVEPGWHPVTIVAAEVRQPRDPAGDEYINIKAKNDKGRLLYDRLSLHPNSRKRLQRFFACASLPHKGKVTLKVPEDMVGKSLRFHVVHVEDEDGFTEEQITQYKKA